MKKRLLSLALSICMLAALLPAAIVPAQADMKSTLRVIVWVDPPEKGGNINRFQLQFFNAVGLNYDNTYAYCQHVWKDEDGHVIDNLGSFD